MNISETMESIRWLMEKHLGKYDGTPIAPISDHPLGLTPRVVRPPANTAFVLEALRRYEQGQSLTQIALEMNSTMTTIGNIVKRRNSYAKLPVKQKDIIAFMKARNRQ